MPAVTSSSDQALQRLRRLLLYETRDIIAERLGNGDSLNKWLAPTHPRPVPPDYWAKIDELYFRDSQIWEPGDFEYAGTRSVDYAFSMREDGSAMEALERALSGSTLRLFAPNGPGIDFDFFVRSAPLSAGVFAHLAAAGPRLLAVVVNEQLTPEKQLEAVWAEYCAHAKAPILGDALPAAVGYPVASEMTSLVCKCRRITEKELAEEMSGRLANSGKQAQVRHQEIDDWLSGRAVPSHAKADVLQKLYAECHRFWPAVRFTHICTLATEDYEPAAREADEAIRAVLVAGPGFAPATGSGTSFDLHVRSARLGPDVAAHRFRGAPGVHVILVSAGNSTSPDTQMERAAREISAALSGNDLEETEPLPAPAGRHHAARGSAVESGTKTAGGRKENNSSGSWVDYRSRIATDWKRLLAAYAVKTWISFNYMVQLGSGTTLNEVMHNIIATQRRERARWDLTILTTNLDILEHGRKERAEDINLFGGMQIQLTGGALQPSLHSLIGEYAAHGVATDLMTPTLVFFGVAGLTFRGAQLKITYQYEDELTTQIAYATRQTTHRVILCDHTKLGTTSGFDARLTFADLLNKAETCTIVTTYPEGDSAAIARILLEVEAFAKILADMKSQRQFEGKDLSLHVVKKEGADLAVVISRSLRDPR